MTKPGESTTNSAAETRSVGEELSKRLKSGDVVAFYGDLGAGKTTMIKGIARGLGIDPDEVSSPSFALIDEYSGTLSVHHIDLYRIEKPSEITELGLWEILDGDGVSLIEWADRAKELLPGRTIEVKITRIGPNERLIEFADFLEKAAGE